MSAWESTRRRRGMIAAVVTGVIVVAMLPSWARAAEGNRHGKDHGHGGGKVAKSVAAGPKAQANGPGCTNSPCGRAAGHEKAPAATDRAQGSPAGKASHGHGHAKHRPNNKKSSRPRARRPSQKRDVKSSASAGNHATVAVPQTTALETTLAHHARSRRRAHRTDSLGAASLSEIRRAALRPVGLGIDNYGALLESVHRMAFPLALTLLVVAFLLVQSFIDRRDPKLAEAPESSTQETLAFV